MASDIINNEKLIQIKDEFKALNWSTIAEEAGLRANFVHDMLRNQRKCTLKSAEKLLPILQKYGIKITQPEDLVGDSSE
ncbi:MAG TPA: hypothetical protein DCS93_04255 [Microscillaceae bacterium]|nr:hypothetical protein [Microscillaceae bacterium]